MLRYFSETRKKMSNELLLGIVSYVDATLFLNKKMLLTFLLDEYDVDDVHTFAITNSKLMWKMRTDEYKKNAYF